MQFFWEGLVQIFKDIWWYTQAIALTPFLLIGELIGIL